MKTVKIAALGLFAGVILAVTGVAGLGSGLGSVDDAEARSPYCAGASDNWNWAKGPAPKTGVEQNHPACR